MNITIYTPLPLERQAVLFHLEATEEIQIGSCLGIRGQFKGLYHSFQVTVIVTGSGNSLIASVVERTIVQLNPSLVFLVGIAGGVKDVQIGDVTIGTKSYGYESGKAKDSGFKIRPQVFPASRDLLTLAEFIEYQNKWGQRSPQTLSISKVVFGPIASGDKVIATTNSPVYQRLKQAYNDTIALEMEAFGFGQALHAHPNVRWLNVRGISDLLDNKHAKSDAKHQPLAAAQAAAFVFEMLYQFDASKFNLPIMNVKDLTKVIYDILFPIGRLESVQDIGKDLSEATNASVRKLWQKVKPLFIEEFEELQAEPADEDAQAAIRSKLKRSLSRDEGLKVEVEALAQAILQKEENNASVMVSNSRGVMTGGTVSGNRDVQFGDRNTTSTTNIEQQVNNPMRDRYDFTGNQGNIQIADTIHIHQVLAEGSKDISSQKRVSGIENIHDLIGKNKMKAALEELLRLSKSMDKDVQNQVILLTSRWNRLKQERFAGTVSGEAANIQQNKILMGVLGMLEEFE